MWLLVYIPAVLGILRYRHWLYWRWVLAILVWQNLADFLFAAHGSLKAPEGDGLIMRAMRQATNDGPELAIFAIVFLPIFWGGMIYFIRQLYVAAKAPNLGLSAVRPVPSIRKLLELLGLTAAAAVLVYNSLTALTHARAPKASAPIEESIEIMIAREVASANTKAPTKLDEVTTFLRASQSGRMIVFDFEVESGGVPVSQIQAELQARNIDEMCAAPDMRAWVRAGAIVRYRYTLRPGGQVWFVDVDDAACTGAAKPKGAPPPPAPSPS